MANEEFMQELQKKKSSFHLVKLLLYVGLPVLLVGGSAAYYFLVPRETQKAPTAPVYQTYDVQKGNLAISLSADGAIKNTNTADLSFPIDGTITTLNAAVGQHVKKGDVLGTLDTSSVDAQIKKAQIDLDLAKLNFQKTQAQSNDADIKIATQNLDDAKASVEDVKKQNATNISNAQSAFVLAQSNYTKVNTQLTTTGQASKADLDQATLDVTLAQKNLDTAKSNQQNSQAELDLAITKAYQNAVSDIATATERVGTTLDEENRVLEFRPQTSAAAFDKTYGVAAYYSQTDSTIRESSTAQFMTLTVAYDTLKNETPLTITSDPAAIKARLQEVQTLLDQTVASLHTMNDGLANTITSTTFTKDALVSLRSNFQTLLSSNESQYNSLVGAVNDISSAELSKQNKIQSDANAVTSAENALKSKQQALITLQTKQGADVAGSDDTILNAKTQLEKAQKAIDTAKQDADAKLRSAESQVAVAQQQLNTKLVSTKSTDLLVQEKQIESAELSVKTAQEGMKNVSLIATIDGDITAVNNKVGDTVQKSGTTSVVSIVNKDNFELDANIEQADISKVAVGQKVHVTVDAVNATLEGEVFSVADTGTADNNGIVTYAVKTTIPNTNAKVKVGMTASGEFILKGVENALIIPVSAVVNKEGKPSVEMADKTWVPVTTGFTDGQKVEVLTGLQEGDRILYK